MRVLSGALIIPEYEPYVVPKEGLAADNEPYTAYEHGIIDALGAIYMLAFSTSLSGQTTYLI